MVQPTLDERFRGSPPTRGKQDRRGWVTDDERRFMLWGLKERWPAAKIGRALGVNEATVRRFKRQISDDPLAVLDLGLFETTGTSPDAGSYHCLICGNAMRGRDRIERHVLGHFFRKDVVDAALPGEQPVGYRATASLSSPLPEIEEVDHEPEEPDLLEAQEEFSEPIVELQSEPAEPSSENALEEEDGPPVPDETETLLSEEPVEDFSSDQTVDAEEYRPEDETLVVDQREPDETTFTPIESMLEAALRRIGERSLELEQIDDDGEVTSTVAFETEESDEEGTAGFDEGLPHPTEEDPSQDEEPELENIEAPTAPTEAAPEIRVTIEDVDQAEPEEVTPVAFELDEDGKEDSPPPERESPPEPAPESTNAQDELERLMGEPVVFAPLEELDEDDPEVSSYREAFKKLAARRGALERSYPRPRSRGRRPLPRHRPPLPRPRRARTTTSSLS